MAKIIDNDKGFKVICINNYEATALGFGIIPGACISMHCNEPIFDEIYYIAALNYCMCKSCYEEWYKDATYFEEDAVYENIYFEYYRKQLNLN